jgi:hypothetical protein
MSADIAKGEPARHTACDICSGLKDYEQALQHVQEEPEDTKLPEAVGRLEDVSTWTRRPWLLRCPQCGTYYLYETIYEFLIGFGGSYDEQTVTRLSDEEAAEFLRSKSTGGE